MGSAQCLLRQCGGYDYGDHSTIHTYCVTGSAFPLFSPTARSRTPQLNTDTHPVTHSEQRQASRLSFGFDTEDGMPGNGQKCEEMDRPCEKYNEGRLSYQYRSGDWKPILDDCVLRVIKDLERKAKALVVLDVSVFVARLSNATVQHNQEITQSPVTVRTIVGILVHIADISQNITINKPVMENFLKTVDILVSDKSRETWRKLNTGNTTSNTSTELLSAIEDISSRLSDDSFTINETSIELIRTVIENSYSANSKLPNSTTKILIPQVSKPTSLTIIVFTTLYNVLPTRDTRNNARKSDVQINGDVVVVKVNETLNNISFTFDMIDPSLGNAQCVFWNFNHDAWDSTGCEIREKLRCCRDFSMSSEAGLSRPRPAGLPASAYNPAMCTSSNTEDTGNNFGLNPQDLYSDGRCDAPQPKGILQVSYI
ncbi:Adhesion G protein-coupled receptor F5 [Anabarilius grahami]|uniref:Adhesion G protein-coupled receptor F5 n=1 Tax=Anabarilius grahami TaxID=495550 RepID=A0A3N0XPH8_ANAGA|nr:Adhesion G protein-coupled receptor F5 [Anabarilius grahami]